MQDEKEVTKMLEGAEKAMGIIRDAVAKKKLTKDELVKACKEAIDVYDDTNTSKRRRTTEASSSASAPKKKKKRMLLLNILIEYEHVLLYLLFI